MFNLKKNLLLPVILSSLTLPVFAIDNTVIATINGKNIIAEELILTAKQNKIDYKTLDNRQKTLLLNGLLNRVIVAKEAKKMLLDQEPAIKLRINALVDSVLAAAMLERQAKSLKIADSDAKAFYNKNIVNSKQKQYKAKHILVKAEADAKDIAKKLRSGADFGTLAKAKSIDEGSAVKGGDLGWFNPSTMVPTFAAAVKKATNGKVTNPVQSNFGWHVILVEGMKPITPPTFDKSKDKIKQLLLKQKIAAYLDKLKKSHKVVNKLK